MNCERNQSNINGFTTTFAVLHLVTLIIKNGSLHGSDHLVGYSHVGIKGTWAFTVNCSGIIYMFFNNIPLNF